MAETVLIVDDEEPVRRTFREWLEQLWEEPEGELADEAGEEELPSLVPGPREGQRETVQARALLEKAERLLERVAPEDRADVERLLERVRTALTDRRWAEVTAASNELADILFYLEDV